MTCQGDGAGHLLLPESWDYVRVTRKKMCQTKKI